MPKLLKLHAMLPLIFTIVATSEHCSAQLDATSTSRLQLLQQSVQSAGELIYRGDVFKLNTPNAQPLSGSTLPHPISDFPGWALQ